MVKAYVVAAFSKDNTGGNRAGVVFDRPELTKFQKIAIAKALGFSETVFVTPSDKADFCLAYFTPIEEVPLCGHATIATFALLNLQGCLTKTDYTIETKAGILSIKIKDDGLILMEQNSPVFFETLDSQIFSDCLDSTAIDTTLPIEIVSTGLKDIMMPIKSRAALGSLTPDFDVMSKLSQTYDVIGVHAFAYDRQADHIVMCRNFAPLYQINEEAATGTANCALACYLFKNVEKKSEYIFEQGHQLNSISRIIVKITSHQDTIDAVFVGGEGYLIEEKILSV